MKSLRWLALLVFLAGCASPSETYQAGPADNNTPASLIYQVLEIARTEKKAVVVFDLDDTLFDARSRTLPILQEFAKEPETQKNFPEVAKRLESVRPSELAYDMSRTFDNLGIKDADALKAAEDYWAPRFFSDKYCILDKEIPGAAAYVNKIHQAGATVVYFSGRDTPRMGKGSMESLRRSLFPTGKRTELILKPNAKMDDFEFKKGAIARIAKLGKVVGAFENEPKNLNLLGESFPKAVLVFLDTRHSKAPDKPTQESHWVKDYLPTPEPQ